MTNDRVSVGWASISGWAASALLAAAAVAEGIDTSHGLKAAALSAATLIFTNGGRQLQAHGKIKAGSPVAEAIDDGAKALEALQAQAQGNLALVAASPDTLDDGTRPFSAAPA